nr:S8 family serine peptidase [Saprospiraceae bacterium]
MKWGPVVAILIFLLGFLPGVESTAQDRPETEVRTLLQLAEEWKQQDAADKLEVMQRTSRRGFPVRFENERGEVFELMRFRNGMPEYYQTNNVQAAISTGTNHLQQGGRTQLDLQGNEMIVGEWDAGAVLQTHQELAGRVTQRDGAQNVHNHAVHVAGTLIASGVRPDAMGMAPEGMLWAHDWSNDSGEMAEAAADGLLISNHSYGSLSGWAFGDWSGEDAWHWWGDIEIDETEDYKFGFYNDRAAQWDQIAHLAPHYLIVKSAGNNRNDNHSGTHFVYDREVDEWVQSDAFRQPSGGFDGYDCLPTYSNAKNILTVGAVRSVIGGYNNPSDVRMSNFSSWGPTDDGRIKPDIVGDGVGLLSSNGNGNASYNSSSGTSMSGPNVAGSLLLIQELHRDLHGVFMWSSSLKGLAIHTADETGNSEGPDYEFGWGLLNSERAAQFLIDPANHNLREEVLLSGDTLTINIFSNGVDPVKATLCWTDPPATPLPPALNDPTPRLIHDLDMRIKAVSGPDSGTVYYPFILDPANPNEVATTGDNFRDNVEVVFPGVLPQGDYVVQVTHKRPGLRDHSQAFSLLISSPPAKCTFDLSVAESENPNCYHSMDGEVVLQAEGANGPVTYSQDGVEFQPSPIFENRGRELTYYYALDSTGCVATTSQALEPPETINVSISSGNQVSVRILEPLEHRQEFGFNNSFISSNWGGDPGNGPITAEVVMVDDGSGSPILGCNELINSSELEGKIAVAWRGSCQFSAKALFAQNAGAKALIIINNEGAPVNMGGGNDAHLIDIPVYMISTQDGNYLRNLLDTLSIEMTLGPVRANEKVSCIGSTDGSLAPFVYGGITPYSYEWSTGEQTESISGLAPGTYTLTVTDGLGCETPIEMEVKEPDSLKLAFTFLMHVSCEGNKDGQATAMGVGGEAPYTFEWEDGTLGSGNDSLAFGYHRLTVTDNRGCKKIDSVYIDNPPPFELERLFIEKSCQDAPDGKIELFPAGGTPPFEFFWPDLGMDQPKVDSLSPGTYSFMVTDACGNGISDTVEIGLFESLNVEISSTVSPKCGNENTGEIQIEVSAEADPIEIRWSTGQQSDRIADLEPGIYAFTVTDGCGGMAVDTIELTAPDPIEIELMEIRDPSCFEEGDGIIEVAVSGGVGNYNLEWNTGDSSLLLDKLNAGRYVLQVSDSIGCIEQKDFLLTQPDPLHIDFEVDAQAMTVSITNLSDSAIFQWDLGDQTLIDEVNPVHTYEEEGEYEICLTAFGPCDTLVLCKTINITGTRVHEEHLNKSFKVFPNPGSHMITIEIASPRENEKIYLYNALGQLIEVKPEAEKLIWDVNHLSPGIYLIQRNREYRKFIKQ